MADSAKINREDGATPIRLQLRDILLQEINDRKFVPGERFASERELASRFGISRSSVRETFADLINAGILARSSSGSTVLTAHPPKSTARQIAFLISDDIFRFVQTGYNRILRGVEDVCRKNGDVLVFQSITDDFARLSVHAHDRPSGYVIVGGVRRALLDQLRQSAIPIVLVDLLIRGHADEIDSVKINYAGGTKMAVEHLYRLGHRRIGFIGFAGSDKYEAYWQALAKRKLTYNPRHVEFLYPDDLEPGILAGFEAAQRIIKRPDLPTAMLATNDCVARGVIEALAIGGLRVPADLSVVGYDDLGISAPPKLTTIQVDLERVGQLAMEALGRRMIDSRARPTHTSVPVALVERGSSSISPRQRLAKRG